MARKISLDGLNQINNILSGGMRQPASLRDEQPLAESVSQPKEAGVSFHSLCNEVVYLV